MEADQIGNHLRLRQIRDGAGFLEVLVGLLQVDGVETCRDAAIRRAGAVHFLANRAVRAFDHARIERMLLAEILQIRQRHAAVERVRARLDDVLSRRRRLRRNRRLEGPIEQRRAEGPDLAREIRRGCERRQIRIRRLECPVRLRLQRGLQQRVECEGRQKLLRRVFVVVAAVRPEEQRVAADVRERLGRDACRVRDDLLEQPLLADAVRRELIVDDRIDGDRRLRQPVRQRLVPRVELPEALGLELEKPCVADALDDRAVAGRRLLRRLTGCHEWAGHGHRQQQAGRHRSDVHITTPRTCAAVGHSLALSPSTRRSS